MFRQPCSHPPFGRMVPYVDLERLYCKSLIRGYSPPTRPGTILTVPTVSQLVSASSAGCTQWRYVFSGSLAKTWPLQYVGVELTPRAVELVSAIEDSCSPNLPHGFTVDLEATFQEVYKCAEGFVAGGRTDLQILPFNLTSTYIHTYIHTYISMYM